MSLSSARRRFALTIPLLGAIALVSCTEETTTNPNTYTPDKAHGEYLVKHVSACGDCHTPYDQTGTPIAGKEFAGGYRFDFGPFVGAVYSSNITSDSATGIGAMTDDQIIAAIRTGIVTHMENGTTMKDTLMVMPYQNFASLTDNDVKDIVAFLRSLSPISNKVPDDTLHIPRSLVPKLEIPAPSTVNDTTTRGKYLVTIGNCNDCHTPVDALHNPLPNMFLAGGQPFTDLGPQDTVWSRNITPDTATGVGKWTDAQLDSAIAYGRDDEGKVLCPPMPWRAFMGMTTTDRKAIISYLRHITAIKNEVPENAIKNCPP